MKPQLTLGEEKVYNLLLKVYFKEPKLAISASVIGKELNKRAPGTGCRYRNWALPVCESLRKKGLIVRRIDDVGEIIFKIGSKANGALAVELAKGTESIGREDTYSMKIADNLEHIQAMRRKNIPLNQIAKILGIGIEALKEFKKIFPQLRYILDEGVGEAVSAVENSLFRKALGYDYEEIKTTDVVDDKGKSTGQIRITKTTKHVQADIGAIAMFLLNRDSAYWKDKRHLDVSGELGFKAILAEIANSEEKSQPSRIKEKLDPKKAVEIQQQA